MIAANDTNYPHGKALIVTLYSPERNIGNALQHYALQESVKGLGFEADSLICPMKDPGLYLRLIDSVNKKINLIII